MNRHRPTIEPGKRQRLVRDCEWCGGRYEIYHLTDRFCCPACRMKYWNAETAKAMGRRNVAMRQAPELQKRSLDDICSEAVTTFPTSDPQTWECQVCGREWVMSVKRCICSEAVDTASQSISTDSVD